MLTLIFLQPSPNLQIPGNWDSARRLGSKFCGTAKRTSDPIEQLAQRLCDHFLTHRFVDARRFKFVATVADCERISGGIEVDRLDTRE